MTVDMIEEEVSTFVNSFNSLCLLMHRNLSTRASTDYIFKTPLPNGTLELRMFAGPDSLETICVHLS